jgi:hypothetical protein
MIQYMRLSDLAKRVKALERALETKTPPTP